MTIDLMKAEMLVAEATVPLKVYLHEGPVDSKEIIYGLPTLCI